MNYDLMAYRPEAELLALIAQAETRLDFHAEQIAMIAHAQAAFYAQQQAIVKHYQAMMEADQTLVREMRVYLDGGAANGFDPKAIERAPEVTNDDLIKKQQLVQQFNTVGDHTPSEKLGGRSPREVVASAKPMPQAVVDVIHYEPGDELPPEALPGHMSIEPRSAEQLRQLRDAKSQQPAVQVTHLDSPPPSAVQVEHVPGGMANEP